MSERRIDRNPSLISMISIDGLSTSTHCRTVVPLVLAMVAGTPHDPECALMTATQCLA